MKTFIVIFKMPFELMLRMKTVLQLLKDELNGYGHQKHILFGFSQF